MSPRRAIPEKKKQGGLPPWVIFGAVVIVALVGVLGIAQIMSAVQTSVVAPVSNLTATGRTRGDPNAPVKLVEFSDYQWPYCRDFAVGAERRIEENYVKLGKVSITYKYFPVVDQGRIGESHWAAQAAECANLQGKFWEYHDKLFSVWSGENRGTYSKPNLKKYASDFGLDTGKFNQCLDTDQTMSTVQADTGDATRLGVAGTPTFFVNGKLMQVTTLDYGEFSRTFDSLLK